MPTKKVTKKKPVKKSASKKVSTRPVEVKMSDKEFYGMFPPSENTLEATSTGGACGSFVFEEDELQGAIAVIDSLDIELAVATERVQTLELQLSGCSLAAAGWDHIPHELEKGQIGWSIALDDVKHLRERMEAAEAALVRVVAERDAAERECGDLCSELIGVERQLERALDQIDGIPGATPLSFLPEEDVEDWVECNVPSYIETPTVKGPVTIDGCKVTLDGVGPLYLMEADMPDGERVVARFDSEKVWHLDPVPEDRRARLSLACQRLLGVI